MIDKVLARGSSVRGPLYYLFTEGLTSRWGRPSEALEPSPADRIVEDGGTGPHMPADQLSSRRAGGPAIGQRAAADGQDSNGHRSRRGRGGGGQEFGQGSGRPSQPRAGAVGKGSGKTPTATAAAAGQGGGQEFGQGSALPTAGAVTPPRPCPKDDDEPDLKFWAANLLAVILEIVRAVRSRHRTPTGKTVGRVRTRSGKSSGKSAWSSSCG